jgi:hypothetical protein
MFRPEYLLKEELKRVYGADKDRRRHGMDVFSELSGFGGIVLPDGRVITGPGIGFMAPRNKCRVELCDENHSFHICRNCGDRNSDHRSFNCPRKRNRCLVRGCETEHPMHHCRSCGITNSTHFSDNCKAATRYSMPVPSILSERGIVHVSPTPKSRTETRPTSKYDVHYCKVCMNYNPGHMVEDCPRYKCGW